jgi:hypothetical protein
LVEHIHNPWFWAPLAGGIGLAVLVAIYAHAHNKSRCPLNVRESFFNGPARNWAGAGGTALTLLPILLSAEIRVDPTSASLLGAAALLFALSTVLGFRLYTSVHSLPKPDDKSVRITSPRLIVEQGIVYTLIITALVCVVLFLFYSPVLGGSAVKTELPPPPIQEKSNGR